MKKLSVITIALLTIITSCAGPLWEGDPRSAGKTDLHIIIEDPLLVYMIYWDDYAASDDYGIIPFLEWVEENK